MGSGLIYAVIIGMWAAYFIPMYLRRHEERSAARSVDRFSHAMRILARRSALDELPLVPSVPERPAPTAPVGMAVPSSRPVARSVAFRRRRILAGLLAVTVLSLIVVPVSALPWPVAALTGSATLAYILHLRLQARRRRELYRSRESVRRRAVARLRRFDVAERIFSTSSSLRAERAAAEFLAADGQLASHTDGWVPVPVPLPTYVTKPVAPRPPVRVDEEQPFDQTSPASAPARSVVRNAPDSRSAHGMDAGNVAAEHRRAVND